MATDDLLRILTPDRPAPIYPLPAMRELGISRPTISARSRVRDALAAGGSMTVDELVAATGLVRSTVRWALGAMEAQSKPNKRWSLA